MTTPVDKALEHLAAKLPEFKQLDLTERHMFLLWAITQGTNLIGVDRPILVGGGAIEFYTGVRFSTGDLDLVVEDKVACEKVLESLGFIKASESKYYVNRELGSLVDLHGARLGRNEETVDVTYRKVPLSVVSPEDCIAERLAGYRKHESTLDLLSAFFVLHHNHNLLDHERLQERIGSLDVWEQYRLIQAVSRHLVLHHTGVDEAAGELIQFIKKGVHSCAF
jgi:hypothetical protein